MRKTRGCGQSILFCDLRHIACESVAWLSPEGDGCGAKTPARPQVEIRAEPVGVLHRVRFVAQPATKSGPAMDWHGWDRILYGEVYCSWYLEVDRCSILATASAAMGVEPAFIAICGVPSRGGVKWSAPQRCPIELPDQSHCDGLTFFINRVARQINASGSSTMPDRPRIWAATWWPNTWDGPTATGTSG